MAVQISLHDLLEYTAWERENWFERLLNGGEQVLKISAGPHGDGRFQAVGELLRHIFSAEIRYVDRLSGRPLTDTSAIPDDNLEALYRFSQKSRRDLEELVKTFPSPEWDAQKEFKIMDHVVRATPKKIVTHVLMHEIRHWAQIATLLRLNGLVTEPHDFLFSPAMSGKLRGEREKA
jgi:uncharacterized damage-inducible protein DinB